MNLGFHENQVIEAYQASNKDEQLAVNYLLNSAVEGAWRSASLCLSVI